MAETDATNFEKVDRLKKIESSEPWYKKTWRPTMAFIYLLICLFDFVLAPTYIEMQNSKDQLTEQLAKINEFDKFSESIQQEIVKSLTETREWKPLTLQGGGLIHLAFGALLTGAAITRGLEKKERVSKI